MSQLFYIHPDNPQPRLINQAVEVLRKGGVIVYPTDSGYALGCKLEEKAAMERICRIRQLDGNHNFTLMVFAIFPSCPPMPMWITARFA
ncbi:Putative translation factor (SUA5) [Serratia odorifera]|uniref:Translation factor (SUA5) n=1 Tax=Serratia odorifera TaxID=618 RepID=A0A3S4DR17_SEROD|nr:Putative translation factor (SUA5) [Serratia odorifera]